MIKPSELTNGTTLILGEILLEAGLPKGVVNIVTGLGPTVGEPLINHPDIDMVSFTGSTRIGRHIAAEAGRSLKKVSLELGGKNPQIIFPDCDWEAAVDAVVFGVYFNAGECCNSGSRILVHADIAERFTQAVIDRSKQVSVGDPLHPDVKVGAITSETQLNIIETAIKNAKAEALRYALAENVFQQPQVCISSQRLLQMLNRVCPSPMKKCFISYYRYSTSAHRRGNHNCQSNQLRTLCRSLEQRY